MAKKHIKIYYKAMKTPLSPDFKMYSEISGTVADDIHHICTREDRIENLMAVTRKEHIVWGDKKHLMYDLLIIHQLFLGANEIPYEEEWFEVQLARWEPEQKF